MKLFFFKYFLEKTKLSLSVDNQVKIKLNGFFLKFFSKGKYLILEKKPISDYINYILIKKSEKIKLSLPKESSKKLNLYYDTNNLELGFAVFDNALVSPDSNLVYYKNNCYYPKLVLESNNDEILFESDTIIKDTPNFIFLDNTKKGVFIEKAISFCGNWPTNWYHLMIEIMSKIALLEKLPIEFMNYPILISEEAYNKPNQNDLINSLLNGKDIIPISSSYLTSVKNLIYIDSPVMTPPNYRNNNINRFEKKLDYNINLYYYGNYRNFLLSKIINKTSDLKNVFLARKQEKRIYNQDEFFGCIEPYGFKKIYIENYSFFEQANIFKNADFIIGPTGAAWANLIFSKPHQKGIILMPNFAKESTVYSNLSYLSNVDLYHCFYDCLSKNWIEYMNSDEAIKIDVSDFLENYIQIVKP